MTKVKLNIEKCSLEVEDHAGAGEKGYDTVCASVSTLVYTLAQNVLFSEKSGQLREKPEIKLESGKAAVKCRPKTGHKGTVQHVFMVIDIGFRLLALNYPEYIVLNSDGE